MTHSQESLWRGIRPLLGTVVGVGIFGLPFVFAQAGYPLAFAEMVIVAGMNLLALIMYAELSLGHKGHPHFANIIGDILGPFGKILASLSFFGGMWGALVAYIVVGGSFLHTLLGGLGGEVYMYQVVFWLFAASMILGGLSFINRLQAFLIPIFFLLLGGVVGYTLMHVNGENILTVQPENYMLPLGAILFAFSGMAAVPEMRDVLGRDRRYLIRAIIVGTLFVALIYTCFTLAIVGVFGTTTAPQALESLARLSPVLALIGSLIGLCTVFTAFLNIGTAIMNTFLYDYRLRYGLAWLLTVSVPLIVYFIGAHDFIPVISFTGGVLGSCMGILVVLAYEKARHAHHLSKHTLLIPRFAVFLVFLTFVAMFGLTLSSVL